MDRREEDVIISCGLYHLAKEEKQKKKWIHKMFRERERKEIFTICLDV
jgi:hypothetical protein